VEDRQRTLALALQIRDQQLADGMHRFRDADVSRILAASERHRQELQRLTTRQAEGQEYLRRAAESVQNRADMQRLGGTWTSATGLSVGINQVESDAFDGQFGAESGRWSLKDGKLCFQRAEGSYVARYQYRLDADGKTLTLREFGKKGPKQRADTITLRRR
jgi:hypothetical protein